MIKIYKNEETKTELKTPMLQIDKNGLDFVDENGNKIAYFIRFGDKILSENCKQMLEAMGYRTDFANWDDENRFCGFKEGVK